MVLLVDAEQQQVGAILEQQLDSANWTVSRAGDLNEAREVIAKQEPALIVLNVDIAQGWPMCMELKRSYPRIPVIVVSYRFGKEVFNNHQKLDTRADAYHRLPEEQEGLEISIGYFSSHKSEARNEVDEGSSLSRPRVRRTAHTPVPSGVLQRLEATVAEQARALEDARRQIEALEVERDAVAEKNRRQMLELMTVSPTTIVSTEAESSFLKGRITELEADVILLGRREEELNDLRAKLATKASELERAAEARASLEAALHKTQGLLEEANATGTHNRQMLETQIAGLKGERSQLTQRVADLEDLNKRTLREAGAQINESLEAAREAARREANESAEKLARASEEIARLKGELSQGQLTRTQLEQERKTLQGKLEHSDKQLAEAVQRAEAAESAWSAVNARLEQVQSALQAKTTELEQAATDKKSTEEALATSRRLMREYATDAARKAEDLKAIYEKVKEFEAQAASFTAAKEELTQALEFEKSLVASLEKDLAAARAAALDMEKLKALEEKAAKELAAVKQQAEADLEVAMQTNIELEVQKGELERTRASLEKRIEELTAAQRSLAATLEAGPDAAAAYASEVHTRFVDVVGYARTLELRLSNAEMARSRIEAKLEQLASEVRSQAIGGEPPPPMALPAPRAN